MFSSPEEPGPQTTPDEHGGSGEPAKKKHKQPSTPDEPGGASEPAKKKRKQLSSCDTCRLRRVKCIRESEEGPCDPCKAKNINCTSEYITQAKAPKAQRAGRLIIQAKEKFGTVAQTPTFAQSGPSSGPSLPPIQPELAAHLAERFFSLIHFQVSALRRLLSLAQLPVLAWETFHSRFTTAGCDPTKLSETGEALCWVVLAFGARVSDSPAILGPDAPSISSLRDRTRRGEDLSKWGRARESFCQMMLDRAVRKCDEHAIMRKPSVDSISALILLTYLVEHGDVSHFRGRMYSAAAYEQLRALISQNGPDDKSEETGLLKGGRIFWCCFVKDSLVAAHTGRAPQLTQIDIECFCPQVLEVTHESVRSALQEDDPAAVCRGYQVNLTPQVARAAALGLFGQVALLARSVNERLSGPIARRRPQLDLAFIEKFWSDIEVSSELCTLFRSRLEELFPIRAGTFELWLRTLIICRLALVAHIDAMLRDHLVAGEIAYGDSPATDPHYLAEVKRMSKQSSVLLFKCMLQTMDIVKTAALTGLAIGGGLLLNNLARYATLILETPVEEDGGVPGFSMHTKIENLNWMNAALRSLGWSWDDGHASISLITSALETLRDKAKSLGISDAAALGTQTTATPSSAPPATPAGPNETIKAPSIVPNFVDDFDPSIFDNQDQLMPWDLSAAGAPPLLFDSDLPGAFDVAGTTSGEPWMQDLNVLLQPQLDQIDSDPVFAGLNVA